MAQDWERLGLLRAILIWNLQLPLRLSAKAGRAPHHVESKHMPADLQEFGKDLRKLRQARGIAQKEIVARVGHLYSDESAYRRLEQGKRRPDRRAILELLTKGLLEDDVRRIDHLLSLTDYDGMSDAEVREFGLTRSPDPGFTRPSSGKADDSPSRPDSAGPNRPLPAERNGITESRAAHGIWLTGSISCAIAISWLADGDVRWFIPFTSAFYASLYVSSLFLETAYRPYTAAIMNRAVFVFCFMMVTSSIALVTDLRFVATSQAHGAWLALAIFLMSAALQWTIVRTALPEAAVVVATSLMHTAQAAHLKNTGYFLVIVVLFWLFPFHCVVTIRHEMLIGHIQAARHFMGDTSGGFCPKPLSLWGVFLILAVIAVLVNRGLLDHLEDHPLKSRYMNLFYIRQLLYISLCAICLAWYTLSFASLSQALLASR